jgi:O-methyltransferase
MHLTRTLKLRLLKAMMGVSYRVPLLAGRVGHEIYPYMFPPRQLIMLAALAEQASNQAGEGSFVEAGCAYGATTVFLNRLMDSFANKHEYYAIDTFSGFIEGDVEHEVTQRGKPSAIASQFVVNAKKWFDRTLELQSITRVRSVQADVGAFDFGQIAPICFCLLDVDLYLPIKRALPNIVDHMAHGGVVVVDDCGRNHDFDGAELAYREFCAERGFPYTVIFGKLGIIEIPRDHQDRNT